MTSKHADPEYQRNARLIRAQVKRQHRIGEPVLCWRCRRAIAPGQPFDVGHVRGATGHSLAELAPEHRHQTPWCQGNRRAGGVAGAAITNRKRAVRIDVPATSETTWTL